MKEGRTMIYQDETKAAYKRLGEIAKGTVAYQQHTLGMTWNEPLIVAMDSMIRYAKAHNKRFEFKLAEDYFLGAEWLSVVKGIRALLNGNGAVANERGITSDSKDNGTIEDMFWKAMEIAGFTEEDL